MPIELRDDYDAAELRALATTLSSFPESIFFAMGRNDIKPQPAAGGR